MPVAVALFSSMMWETQQNKTFVLMYMFGEMFSTHTYRMGTVCINLLKLKFADLNSLVL
jgi:hypothetical protein